MGWWEDTKKAAKKAYKDTTKTVKKAYDDTKDHMNTKNSVLDMRKANPFGEGGMLDSEDGGLVRNADTTENKREEKKAADKKKDLLATDESNLDKFKSQSLLDNPDLGTDLYRPTIKNKKMSKEMEALSLLYNQRKSQILQSKYQPGMNQTRFS
jgi:hypothetical protein